jgi:hypothetical protein
MAGTRRFSTAIAARGRIYVAAGNRVYAFALPVAPVVLTGLAFLAGGQFQFAFTNNPGISFTAFTATNLTQPGSSWTRLGFVPEVSPGHFQFVDSPATDNQPRFYRVRSP